MREGVSAPVTSISSENTSYFRKLAQKNTIPDEQTAAEAGSDGSEVTFSRREPSLIISLLQESRVKGVRPDVGPLIKQRRAGGCWHPCATASIIDEPRSETIRAESGGLVWPCWSFQLSNPAIYISGAPWWRRGRHVVRDAL